MLKDKAKAECSACGVWVEGSSNEFSRPIECPACHRVCMFSIVTDEDEIFVERSVKVAKGVGKVTATAGKFLGKAFTRGIKELKSRHERAHASLNLLRTIQNHLDKERPSQSVLNSFLEQSKMLDISLKVLGKQLAEGSLSSFLNKYIELSKIENDINLISILRRYILAFETANSFNSLLDHIEARYKQILDIQNGKLKSISGVKGLIVRNSEIVWYQTVASLINRTKNGNQEQHVGDLFVTNLRIVFTSRTQPDELSYGDINAIEAEKDRLVILGKSQKNCIELSVEDAVLLKEYLQYATKVYHRQTDVGFEWAGRQPISQEIKQAVWQRDSGRCAECGAKDYLEYDHIIPVSKGGASTTNNLQLLCRRCNLKKSDRI